MLEGFDIMDFAKAYKVIQAVSYCNYGPCLNLAQFIV